MDEIADVASEVIKNHGWRVGRITSPGKDKGVAVLAACDLIGDLCEFSFARPIEMEGGGDDDWVSYPPEKAGIVLGRYQIAWIPSGPESHSFVVEHFPLCWQALLLTRTNMAMRRMHRKFSFRRKLEAWVLGWK